MTTTVPRGLHSLHRTDVRSSCEVDGAHLSTLLKIYKRRAEGRWQHGPAGQAVGVAGPRPHRRHGAGAGARQQRQEHAAGRAAAAGRARARHAPAARRAHRRTLPGPLHQRRRVVQRVGRVGRGAAPRAVGAPLPPRARAHLRRRLRRPSAPRGGARGAGAVAGAPRHVRPPPAAAGAGQQERRAARARAHAGRRRAGPGAHHGQAVAHLCVVRAVGRGGGGRRGLAGAHAPGRAPAARALLAAGSLLARDTYYYRQSAVKR